MEKVSYGFSEALNLADDFKSALQDLQNDPTGSQIVIETNIKDNYNPGSWYDGCLYFLIQKCNYKYNDYRETPDYTLSLSYVEANEKVIAPLLGYEGSYSLDDLKNIVREIIDNIQITRIYPDSL